jgi:YVTN family beta-propeller protein
VGHAPQGVAVDMRTNTIYVANENSNTVSVINGQTNRVVATIPGIPSPGGVTVNQEAKKAIKVYVTNIFENTVTLLTS